MENMYIFKNYFWGIQGNFNCLKFGQRFGQSRVSYIVLNTLATAILAREVSTYFLAHIYTGVHTAATGTVYHTAMECAGIENRHILLACRTRNATLVLF